MFLIFILGFLGGIIRGLVGFIKHQLAYKNVEFKWNYFLGMTFLSGIIGLVSALAVKGAGLIPPSGSFTPAFAVIIGYAGGDFLESVYKMIIQKSSFYPLSQGK